jgi:hypothetical protein
MTRRAKVEVFEPASTQDANSDVTSCYTRSIWTFSSYLTGNTFRLRKKKKTNRVKLFREVTAFYYQKHKNYIREVCLNSNASELKLGGDRFESRPGRRILFFVQQI